MTGAAGSVIDGETFDGVRDGSSIHHTWVGAPNRGYEFSVGGSGAAERTDDEVRAEMRAFLSGIDRRTGYLAD